MRQELSDLGVILQDLVNAVRETNSRLTGIENRLLEERAVSQADIYQRITALQKQMYDNGHGRRK
jgi:DNA-binding winged helix-turn-helix (wHTH) protein